MLGTPIALANLFEHAYFSVSSMSMVLSDNRRFAKTAGGMVIGSERGARLWQGSIQLNEMPHREASDLDGRLAFATKGGVSFYMYDPRAAYPLNDPTGSILDTSTPILAIVAANKSDIAISGLPAGYKLRPGDMLGFTYGTDPVRYALHKVSSGATANGTGLMTLLHISPPIRPGYTTGVTQINLIKPLMIANIVPGSYVPAVYQRGLLSSAATFDFMQTLRG